MSRKKLHYFYIRVTLLNGSTRTTRVKASSPCRAIYNLSLKLWRDKALEDVKAITLEEDPLSQPQPVSKDDLYVCITTTDDKYYQSIASGERISVDVYGDLPDYIIYQ